VRVRPFWLGGRRLHLAVGRDISERKRAEEERRQSAERFRAIADYTYDWESWFGVDGKLLWVNPAVERITGYSVDECRAMPDFPMPIVAEPDRQAVAAQMKDAVQGSSRNDFEFRVRYKKGHLAWVAASWQPIYDSQGARLGYRSSIRDIADRKQAEEALRQSETYLAEAQKLSHTGSWAFDIASNKYVYVSEECRRIFELDGQEYPTREALSRLIHPEDWGRVQGDFEKLLRERVDTSTEFRIVLPSGAVKHIQTTRHPVLNHAGEAITIVGTVIDITERKRAEESLRESEERFRVGFEDAAVGITLVDTRGYAIQCNPALAKMLGYSEEEVRRMVFTDFTFPDDRELDWGLYRELMTGVRKKYEVDKRYVTKDGRLIWGHLIVSLVRDSDGAPKYALRMTEDITERKRAEQEREKLRQLEADLARMDRVSMLGELAASLAHEIKQPIAAAATNAKTCLRWIQRDPPEMQKAREATERIVKNVMRAAEIIDRNRSLYRRDTPKRQIVNLNQLIREMIALLHDAANRHSVSIHAALDAPLPAISADRVQIQQVLMNLMLNGIEAMNDTGGELTIRSKTTEEGHVLVSVSDLGVGLPVENPERLFDAFFTTKPQGSGMGLSISRRIIESHAGRLWATANPGRGATFHFTLPAEVKAVARRTG